MTWSNKRIVWTAILAVVSLVILVWGGYALSVAMSGPKGVGDGIKQKNSSTNWIAAQAEFEDRYEQVITLDKKIKVHREALDKKPDDSVLQTNLTGVTSACMSAVADYNADSRKYLKEDFKSANLPYQIDDTLAATDCR